MLMLLLLWSLLLLLLRSEARREAEVLHIAQATLRIAHFLLPVASLWSALARCVALTLLQESADIHDFLGARGLSSATLLAASLKAVTM